jgi:hypothetical protein
MLRAIHTRTEDRERPLFEVRTEWRAATGLTLTIMRGD